VSACGAGGSINGIATATAKAASAATVRLRHTARLDHQERAPILADAAEAEPKSRLSIAAFISAGGATGG
jgi:hypothetical protein